MCFKTIGLAYSWKEITVFALFYFVFEGKFHVQAPGGGLHLERRFNGGFLGYKFGGLIHGGVYFQNFTVYAKEPKYNKTSSQQTNFASPLALCNSEVPL